MRLVRLVHWNLEEAEERAELLRAAGYRVACEAPRGPDYLNKLRKDPPLAVVIDLSRIPSHGRDIALAIRQYKDTRHVPLVFVGGDPEKVVRIRSILPDAVYTLWSRIRGAMRRAISSPLPNPAVPRSRLEGYSGVPLPKKLGIKAGSTVALVDAPEPFDKTLGDLPEGARLLAEDGGSFDLMLWFVRSSAQLQSGMKRMAARIGDKPLWIIWPKKTSGLALDLTQQSVRSSGLAEGLVDYKVCAVDATWSGLLFRRRKSPPHKN
jgi:CheY-like chemotaxis protein